MVEINPQPPTVAQVEKFVKLSMEKEIPMPLEAVVNTKVAEYHDIVEFPEYLIQEIVDDGMSHHVDNEGEAIEEQSGIFVCLIEIIIDMNEIITPFIGIIF